MNRTFALVLPLLSFLACGGDPKPVDPRYPPRAVGCEVQVFADVPPMQTDNLGAVSANCAEDISREDCMRTLKDQACKMGGDIVWGVPDKPEMKNGRSFYSGRAAHTKAK